MTSLPGKSCKRIVNDLCRGEAFVIDVLQEVIPGVTPMCVEAFTVNKPV